MRASVETLAGAACTTSEGMCRSTSVALACRHLVRSSVLAAHPNPCDPPHAPPHPRSHRFFQYRHLHSASAHLVCVPSQTFLRMPGSKTYSPARQRARFMIGESSALPFVKMDRAKRKFIRPVCLCMCVCVCVCVCVCHGVCVCVCVVMTSNRGAVKVGE
jgi:hypothetical protein